MLSHSTNVRLAPVDPVARNETPCVVGFATTLDERRNRLKPGIWRKRSSSSAPGISCSCWAPTIVIAAGVSLERTVLTVTLVFRGVGLDEFASGAAGACAVAVRMETIARAKTITCNRIVKVMDEHSAAPAGQVGEPASRATRILKGT